MRAAWVVVLAGCGRLGFGAAELPPDADVPDAPDGRTVECDPEVSADTVALYSFEGDVGTDASGGHSGAQIGTVTSDGGRCGSHGAKFGGGFIRIPDSPAFDLPEGSVELFAQIARIDVGRSQGLISRDALNTDFNGHFTLALTEDGHLFVRLQRIGNLSVYRCTKEPVPTNQWIHIGISFGPPGLQMWLDHVEVTGTELTVFGGDAPVSCTEPHAFGIDGNDQVLAIGGLMVDSANGDPVAEAGDVLDGGLIDHVHLRSTWRDFSLH